ncbi:hypothetical protein CIW62_22430 [Enterobacter cloacae]|uniref:hypothetical protein n=1 Tax=Enterobacter cloacae TaxID=550 RepID=UPI000BA85218|nr:hypothetical protein [Enterobacter cloacae]PAN94489.1 hypothetical protein CIW62_22430 [Enterobacter cloacae]HAS1065452.1 hypothetical protein [Enterobacter cloacae]HAS1097787.1 hypothetical protein [Enterobacter cloacae]
MALISCFTSPQGLQGMLTCLRDTEGMTGILVIVALLAGWIAVQYIADARRVRLAWESRPGLPVPVAQFGSARHADAVHAFANREYYQVMLAELEKALIEEGYALTRDESLCVTIPEADRQKISRRIILARQCYTSPRVSEQAMQDNVDAAVNDGYAGSWLSLLIRGSEREGWYITKPVPEFVPTNFPLKQVIITVSAKQSVLTRDVVRIINDVAEKVKKQRSFPETPERIAGGVISTELFYGADQRQVKVAPGWFNSPSGNDVPDDITEGQFPPVGISEHRHFIVRAQAGRFYTPTALAFYIEEAGRRIEQGESSGACYEDDSGYAFAVTPAKNTP